MKGFSAALEIIKVNLAEKINKMDLEINFIKSEKIYDKNMKALSLKAFRGHCC